MDRQLDLYRERLVTAFVQRFILKEKRERTLGKLISRDPRKRRGFTDHLNHSWDTVLDVRYLSRTASSINAEAIGKALGVQNHQECYVISSQDSLDDQFLTFGELVKNWLSFGTIIINPSADKLYFEAEQSIEGTLQLLGHFPVLK